MTAVAQKQAKYEAFIGRGLEGFQRRSAVARCGLSARVFGGIGGWNCAACFRRADEPGNIKNQARMIELAGSADRVVPGHDMLQFQKFPTEGRVAKIKPENRS